MDRNNSTYLTDRTVSIVLQKVDGSNALITMPTEIELLYFATLPMRKEYTDEMISNAVTMGEDLLDLAYEVDDDDQYKHLIFIICNTAKLMAIDTLLNAQAVSAIGEFMDAKAIGSQHFKGTVMSSIDLYMWFITPILRNAGINDSTDILDGINQIVEILE